MTYNPYTAPKRWYAHVSRPSDRWVLYLQLGASIGREETEVTDADAFRAFLSAHPEIELVMVSDSRFPRRGCALDVFLAKHARKIWAGFKADSVEAR